MAGRTITALLLLALSCVLPLNAGARPADTPPAAMFAVTGNTNPESPFVGFNENLPVLVDALNSENPLFVVHTGNMVRGGNERIGIIANDVTRQFLLFLDSAKNLSTPLYTAAGELDMHNGSPELYTAHLGRTLNYSFNYDDIHIIVFNTVAAESPAYDKNRQLQWLRGDLERNKSRGMIIIVTHHSLFSPARGEKPLEGAEEMHDILIQYPVAAVISGSGRSFFILKKDSVSYINAGCGGFSKEDRCYSCGQYYLVTCGNGKVTAAPKTIRIK